MEELKEILAKTIKESIELEIDYKEILDKIEVPKDKKNGDFAYPCFNLAKILKKSPINIANDIKAKINLDSRIDKVEVVNGFLNFYINSKDIVTSTLKK